MIWNWLRRHPLVVDVGLVALILAATTGGATRHSSHTAEALVLGIVGTLPLLRRRQQPLLVVTAVAAVALVMVALGVWQLPFQLGLALYTLAATRERPTARATALVSVAAMTVAVAVASELRFGDAAWRLVFLVAAWLLGDSIGSRRAYVREIEQKAERLEREREAEARRAVAEEQARIARELHDVVAHALSVIVVQAGAADDVFEVDPRRTREPIRAIDAAARTALGDLRRVLGILQQDADYEPQPGLGRLDSLIEQVRATGLDVSLEIAGTPRALPAAVDLSAYRIVQEALTNALKHAEAEHVTVRVRYDDRLVLEIRDDGRATGNGNPGGSGLIGMRERVTLLAGTLETGPAAGGGYLVTVQIPIEEAP
jgi:signal transduction histidine kinase